MQTLETLGEDFKCDLVADKRKLALEISKDPGVVNRTLLRISPKYTSRPLGQVKLSCVSKYVIVKGSIAKRKLLKSYKAFELLLLTTPQLIHSDTPQATVLHRQKSSDQWVPDRRPWEQQSNGVQAGLGKRLGHAQGIQRSKVVLRTPLLLPHCLRHGSGEITQLFFSRFLSLFSSIVL